MKHFISSVKFDKNVHKNSTQTLHTQLAYKNETLHIYKKYTVFVSIRNLASFKATLRFLLDISLQKLYVDLTSLKDFGINYIRFSITAGHSMIR